MTRTRLPTTASDIGPRPGQTMHRRCGPRELHEQPARRAAGAEPLQADHLRALVVPKIEVEHHGLAVTASAHLGVAPTTGPAGAAPSEQVDRERQPRRLNALVRLRDGGESGCEHVVELRGVDGRLSRVQSGGLLHPAEGLASVGCDAHPRRPAPGRPQLDADAGHAPVQVCRGQGPRAPARHDVEVHVLGGCRRRFGAHIAGHVFDELTPVDWLRGKGDLPSIGPTGPRQGDVQALHALDQQWPDELHRLESGRRCVKLLRGHGESGGEIECAGHHDRAVDHVVAQIRLVFEAQLDHPV